MLKSIDFKPFKDNVYPFNIPAINKLDHLDLSNSITIFVGDNGSGKSTLLKAIAYANQSINVSNHSMDSDDYSDIKKLSNTMTCTYDYRSKKGFFFSGEEFISYINQLKQMKLAFEQDLVDIDERYKNKSAFAKAQARSAAAGQLHQMNQIYGGDLKTKSHGEGFLSFFKSRMHQKGVYLLDEPETPLSAINQYQLVVLITDLIKNGSQVILATHSPIIMALNNATIYEFSDKGINAVSYDEIEHVNFMKHFLNHKDNYIDRL